MFYEKLRIVQGVILYYDYETKFENVNLPVLEKCESYDPQTLGTCSTSYRVIKSICAKVFAFFELEKFSKWVDFTFKVLR